MPWMMGKENLPSVKSSQKLLFSVYWGGSIHRRGKTGEPPPALCTSLELKLAKSSLIWNSKPRVSSKAE